MKKLLSLILTLVLCLSLCACGGAKEKEIKDALISNIWQSEHEYIEHADNELRTKKYDYQMIFYEDGTFKTTWTYKMEHTGIEGEQSHAGNWIVEENLVIITYDVTNVTAKFIYSFDEKQKCHILTVPQSWGGYTYYAFAN